MLPEEDLTDLHRAKPPRAMLTKINPDHKVVAKPALMTA
jgi:hypothetical protein